MNFAAALLLALTIDATPSPVVLDGSLDDAAWTHATKFDKFYEYVSSDGDQPPIVATTAWVTYDEKFLYVGVECADPEPSKIRAPYIDRDRVHGDQDFVALVLDTTNEGRTAIQLRVNPRGVQGDAVNNDASRTEHFTPDFFYEAVSRIHEKGWTAEMRVPLATLRYPKAETQTWRLMIVRNYPRAYRNVMASSRIPRGVNCYVCNMEEVTGFRNLPDAAKITLAPYATAEASDGGRPENEDIVPESEGVDVGVDAKWTPNPQTVIDLTYNPDFSQVEADIPQIAVNERFAIFYPEKRPFFLESVDMLDTPIEGVYTRRITAPTMGIRATGRAGSTSYTTLVAQDRGGGLLVLPGTMGSRYAAVDYKATSILGRVRQDIGDSFIAFLGTMREGEEGYNRVFGPDLQWRPNATDRVLAQFLYSDTNDDFGNGESHAMRVQWLRQTRRYETSAAYDDYGDAFRADLGFVPQVGFRRGTVFGALDFYPVKRFFTRFRTQLGVDRSEDRNGRLLGQSFAPGFFGRGRFNSTFSGNLFLKQRVRVGSRTLERTYLDFTFQLNPARSVPAVGLSGSVGEVIDFANAVVGDGANLTGTVVLRPSDHLLLENYVTRQYIDIPKGRLFTADILRLKATYSFTASSIFKIIGQRVHVNREPAFYGGRIPRHSGDSLLSFLYTYKLNWQTVFFVGYGDTGLVIDHEQRTYDYSRIDRSFFVKVAYAFQR
ncbi:MAG TPA: carbohydrate binding family 9 domain-containing protein [Thermoanaerobaculia bacterium]|nr:carbohydrate binding family 9 domain-containing protein [Thermoanaerobaculia bacterium]